METNIDLLGVEHRDAPLDHAALLELLDAAPARRGGKPDLLTDLGNRQSAVPLQNVENFAVHTVEHGCPDDIFARF
jgi:hypothetical protein